MLRKYQGFVLYIGKPGSAMKTQQTSSAGEKGTECPQGTFSRDLKDKCQSPHYSLGLEAMLTNDKCINGSFYGTCDFIPKYFVLVSARIPCKSML